MKIRGSMTPLIIPKCMKCITEIKSDDEVFVQLKYSEILSNEGEILKFLNGQPLECQVIYQQETYLD